MRCTLRYVVLPFALPVLGVATGAALGILLALDLIAAVAVAVTLRRLWRVRHPRRWHNLVLALVLVPLIGLFVATDVGELLG